jgi:large subunit ribosomal protein L10
MAIARADKEKAVAQLQDELGRMKLTVLTDYRGLTVAEIEELRQKMRAEGMIYRVTKNTLVKLAAKDSPLKNVDLSLFQGPMAVAIGFDDEVAPARVIFQYAKQHEALEIIGAIDAEGQVMSAAEVKALALLPTREQLLAQVVGTINAPLSSFVGVMAGSVRSIINVLNAIQAESK